MEYKMYVKYGYERYVILEWNMKCVWGVKYEVCTGYGV
jgi:hypothetical protein